MEKTAQLELRSS